MNSERWLEIERIFLAALDLPPEERSAFVERECRQDDELRAQVFDMLRAGEPAPEFLAPPPEVSAPPSHAPIRQLGDFDLLEEIGRGGMGVVYLAWQRSLGRRVAVKVLPPSATLGARQVERFLREARAAGKLQHAGIVPVLTVGQEGGTYYFAMELVEGNDLSIELKKLREALHGPDSPRHALPESDDADYFSVVARIVRDAADALQFAHDNGIVHRDVKPSNLLVDAQAHVRIVDFGLARDESQGTLTRTGDFAGTPHYMSPEQARGRLHQVDQRTDVYSLGVVLYELLTLQRPFEGKTAQEVMHKILADEPPAVRKLNPRVPRDLHTICHTAMAKDLKRRYASAGALRDDLGRFLAHQAIQAKPPSVWQRCARFAVRHRIVLGAAVLALLATLAGASLALHRARLRDVAGHWSAVLALRQQKGFGELPPSAQVEVRRHLAAVLVDPAGLSADDREEARRLEAQILAYRETQRRQGLGELEAGRDPTKPEGFRELHRLVGLQRLIEAAHLFPEDDDLRRRARIESVYPTLAVRTLGGTGEALADVYVREIDPFTAGVGGKRRLGRTPLPPTPLAPGYYRVVIVFDEGGFSELVCQPGPASMDVRLVARRRADAEPLEESMVLIEACTFTVREIEGMEIFRGQPVELEAYWIDKAEVSNAEYFAFLEASPRPPPRFREQIPDLQAFLQQYGELPVIGVSWADAVAFAEWAGKRLPTAVEWNRAAGGPQGWPTPYSPDALAPPRGNVLAPNESPAGELARWQRYLRFAAPVRSAPEAMTPEGLFHMFGNVYELTESMALVPLDEQGALVPHLYERFFYGAGFDAVAAQVPMVAPSFWGLSTHYLDERVGFRCARSAAP